MKRKQHESQEPLKGVELLESYKILDGLKYNAAIEIRLVLDDICSESGGHFEQAEFDRQVMQLVRDARA